MMYQAIERNYVRSNVSYSIEERPPTVWEIFALIKEGQITQNIQIDFSGLPENPPVAMDWDGDLSNHVMRRTVCRYTVERDGLPILTAFIPQPDSQYAWPPPALVTHAGGDPGDDGMAGNWGKGFLLEESELIKDGPLNRCREVWVGKSPWTYLYIGDKD